MADIVLGIGEAGVTNCKDDTIKTYALGSCIAVVIFDPKTRLAGMVHVAHPDSSIDLEKAGKLPGYFADTGVKHLIELMKEKNSVLSPSYIVKLVGGAKIIKGEDYFQIGKRNATSIKKALWQNNLAVFAEDIGKTISRTVKVEMKTGKLYVSSPNLEDWRV